MVHRDPVGGDPRGVDVRDDEPGTATGEDPVELQAAEERVGDGAEAADVVEVLGGGGDEGVEALRLEHPAQSRPDVGIHHAVPFLKFGSTSRPNSSIASCISATALATKSIPESVVTPASW